MQIIVNGRIVSTMEEALEIIREEMSSVSKPNCKPGSKFSQFNSIVSNQPSNQQQPNNSPSLNPDNGMSIGKYLFLIFFFENFFLKIF